VENEQASINRFRRFWISNRTPILVFAVTRIGLFLVVYLSLVMLPLEARPEQWRAFPENLLIDGWSRWDSGWYTDIALTGYSDVDSTTIGLEGQQKVVFFPGYPIALRAGMVVFGNIHLGGILLSNLTFLAALLLIFHLVKQDFGDEVAERTTILLSVFPFALFFSAVYSESMFLLMAAGAFYFGRRGIWSLAALCCAVATATRLQGVVLPLGLAVLYLEQINFDRSKIRADSLWLLGGFVGIAGFFLYLWLRFAYSPVDYIRLQVQGWGHDRSLIQFFDTLRSLNVERVLKGDFPANNCLHLLITGVSLVMAVYVIRRVRLSYGVWTLASVLLGLSSIYSFARYAMVLFPLFIALALILHKEAAYRTVLYISVLLLALFAVMFSHWYWVA
jgi:hypothetical protein